MQGGSYKSDVDDDRHDLEAHYQPVFVFIFIFIAFASMSFSPEEEMLEAYEYDTAKAQRTASPVEKCHFRKVHRECRQPPTYSSPLRFRFQRNGLAQNMRNMTSDAKYVQGRANFRWGPDTDGGGRNFKMASTIALILLGIFILRQNLHFSQCRRLRESLGKSEKCFF